MGTPDFEPDRFVLERLTAEHQSGTWVGLELLPIAGRIRDLDGDEDDYLRWVTSSNLWTSYLGSTYDTVTAQKRSLHGAWDAAGRLQPRNVDWNLEDALRGLAARVRACTQWPNPRTASRDRVVALAFISFCIDHNCFTRTISCRELAKLTPGMSHKSVSRALKSLLDVGLLLDVERTDRRLSTWSTKRYRLFLRWRPPATGESTTGTTTTLTTTADTMSTRNSSLCHELSFDHDDRDLWSWKGLGPGALRVWEALRDEPMSAKEIGVTTGMSQRSARRFAKKLADAGLAGVKTGRPERYFTVEAPLDVLEEVLGCAGYVDEVRAKIEHQQAANRAAHPKAYGNVTLERDGHA